MSLINEYINKRFGPVELENELLRAYPNNRVVTRPSEKHEDKASGQNPHRRS
jgi:hypothetical protein